MQELNRKIFLTDGEFGLLFGERIMHIVGTLNRTARDVCPPCNGYCCANIRCLFFSRKFSTCPIFEIRPRECRYHFCNDVFTRAPLTAEEKEMMQVPVEELVCGNRGDVAKLFFLFPEFPLDEKGLETLGIRTEVEKIISSFESGLVSEARAFKLLRNLCLQTVNPEEI
jgi:hypothetical protein